ncbi:MAG: peptide/nickel transport system permease protein [Tepidanaerobacteraceae bacterium]|nr:peptide/nickel transport system permease protein [Tepidanaerobacteraceae bacterium]
MLKYIIKRLFQGIFVVIGISILIFIISRVVPGDPARMALGPRAPQFAVDELRKEMNLDKPLPVQYYYWFKGVIKGDFGKSLNTKRPVITDVKEFLPATLELALLSGFLFIIFATIIGLLSAQYRDTWVDGLTRILSYVGIAIPSFVVAVLLLLIFGYLWPVIPTLGRLSSNITPPPTITGLITVDSLITGNFAAFFDALKHLILPAIALAIGPLFQEARILRSALIDNINKEYISVVTGYGLPKGVIMRKHLLKPSFIPVVSVMGLDFASLMGNAFLVESIFNWPGLSRYGINAMLNKDLNAISAVIIIYGVIFLIVNIIVDLIIAWLDPRIRLGGE